MKPHSRWLMCSLGLALSACASLAPELQPAALADADAAMQAAIAQGLVPGGTLWIEHAGQSYHRAYGARARWPEPEKADEQTVYDAASLTKPVVTATLVQVLRERGLLEMDAPLQRYLPECRGEGYGAITLRLLLTHSSGLPAGISRQPQWRGVEGAVEQACSQTLTAVPGTAFRYSDINYILLGAVLARVSGQPLQDLAQDALFAPLGMVDSGYLPLRRHPAAHIAPTQRFEGQMLRGEVHDPTARRMGGVAGHAGLFTTTADLARFARMLLHKGLMDNGRRLLREDSVAMLTTVQSPPALRDAKRSLGWDIDSPYSRPRGTRYPRGQGIGHTGFTGCAMWIDPGSQSFYILLSNRVHPDGPTSTLPMYGALGTAAAAAAGLPPPAAPQEFTQ